MTCTRAAALVPLMVSALLLAGCGGKGADDPSATSVDKDPSTSASPTTNPSEDAASASARASARPRKQTVPTGPLAPATIAPVRRDGKLPRPTYRSATAPIDGTVRYKDGVTLTIVRVSHSKVTGKGPGVVEGPVTTFYLRLSNASSRTLDLDQVVVTTVHGSPARISSPVYLSSSRDFSGKVGPGKKAEAAYSFMTSVAQADEVAVHVDFDGRHTAAVFAGSAN